MEHPVVELRKVERDFPSSAGAVRVLHAVDLAIRRGEFAVITGPSGSGKTTLLNIASLMEHPSEGCVLFDGEDVSAMSERQLSSIRKHRVGVVFQRFHLLTGRSVLDNVLFRFRYLEHRPRDARTLSLDALSVVGMSAVCSRPARVLSAGEMQRVAIARAVAQRPDLLVADEPTGNLDRATAEDVMRCFTELNRQGITILMVTHNEELLRYASRHFLCRDGRVEERPIPCGSNA